MKFNNHSNLEGTHAFLGASNFRWINDDKEQLVQRYLNETAKQRGTQLHELAAQLISLGQKLPAKHKTLNMYVNDAIGYKMTPEQILYYSYNCYGTADSIAFRKDILRIHDLKTGVVPAHMEQLQIYAALFCLEYDVKPGDIKMELRIYQNDDIVVLNPEADDIAPIMDRIVVADKIITEIRDKEM